MFELTPFLIQVGHNIADAKPFVCVAYNIGPFYISHAPVQDSHGHTFESPNWYCVSNEAGWCLGVFRSVVDAAKFAREALALRNQHPGLELRDEPLRSALKYARTANGHFADWQRELAS